jgi:hypothetical protein
MRHIFTRRSARHTRGSSSRALAGPRRASAASPGASRAAAFALPLLLPLPAAGFSCGFRASFPVPRMTSGGRASSRQSSVRPVGWGEPASMPQLPLRIAPALCPQQSHQLPVERAFQAAPLIRMWTRPRFVLSSRTARAEHGHLALVTQPRRHPSGTVSAGGRRRSARKYQAHSTRASRFSSMYSFLS